MIDLQCLHIAQILSSIANTPKEKQEKFQFEPVLEMRWSYQYIQPMRSVSIVYKKPQPRDELREQPHSRAMLKRSVDEYYTKLLEKQRTRQEIGREKETAAQRVKLRTSNSHRQQDRLNILQTLSIAQISLRQPRQEREDRIKAGSLIQGAIQRRIQGSRTVLRGLDLPVPHLPTDEDQQESKNRHCKLKCLLRSKATPQTNKETIIVLTANFIVNQYIFWNGQEQVQELSIKYWRLLQSYANIVWICHKESTMKRLAKFAKNNKLRLDAVYEVVQSKRERRLMYSCVSLQNDFGVKFHRSNTPLMGKDDRKMIVLSGVSIEKGQRMGWQALLGNVPFFRNCRSVVHFIRIDMADKNRLNSVIKVLSQHTPLQQLDLTSVIVQFEKIRERRIVEEECQCPKLLYEEDQSPSVLACIEETKTKITKFLTQSLSINLNDRIVYDQCENSVQFLIGDMLRRNFKVFAQSLEYSSEYKAYLEHRRLHEAAKEKGGNQGKPFLGKYRNPAYYWDL